MGLNFSKLDRGTRKLLADQGLVCLPGSRSRTPEVLTGSPLRWRVWLALPCRVVSESSNRSGYSRHWAVQRRRRIKQGDTFRQAVLILGLRPPTAGLTRVRLTHVGPKMDSHDGLRSAFKGLVDAIAEWLGVDDGDEDRVRWIYRQRPGRPGVEVEITSGGLSC